MDIRKKPYEISLWEDVLTIVYEDGFETEGTIINEHGPVVAQYYKERKICVIGSDTMDTPIRATQPKLVTKVNGENILTFNMYSHYYDTVSDEFYINPFIGLLINERKIKLRYGAPGAVDTKWYDLVIKNIQENSESKTYNYTAKDLFVNELSKSGFNLQFDQELENNMGNIETLAERILDESDWQLQPSGEILKQTLEEPLYHVLLSRNITLKDMEGKKEDITLQAGKLVYVFYNNIVNKERYVQFLYADTYEVDDDNFIVNSPNWYLENVTYNSDGIPDFTNKLGISETYRGRRLVRKIRTAYDSTIDKYVNIYNNGEIYGYSETEYTSPATVRSYVTNPNGYESYTGWEIGSSSDKTFPKLDLVSVPDVRDVDAENILNGNQKFESCLRFEVTNTEQTLYNSGIIDFRHHINGFVQGEKYVFRVKYGVQNVAGAHGASSLKNTNVGLTFIVSEYKLEEGQYKLADKPLFKHIFRPSGNDKTLEYLCSEKGVECQYSLSYSQMAQKTNELGLFIQANSKGIYYIEDVQFFPYINNNGKPLLPAQGINSQIKTIYYYYKPNKDYKSLEEVEFVYKGETQPEIYREVYNDISYEKIRSITASESNRFNLIQELCEIFECWPKFEIEHNPQTGEILLDKNYHQKKWVSFHEYIGKDNYAGFKYGINLKSIQRTVESEGIVSKLIVKDNSNEFATDGFCSIARAAESPNGENFILDFSYYIQQGMMGLAEITNDLYMDSKNSQGYIGYYKELKRINTLRDRYIKEQSGLLTDLSEYQAALQTYNLSVSEADKQYRDKLILIRTLTGLTFEELMRDQGNDWWESEQVVSTVASIGRLKSIITNHQILADDAAEKLKNTQNRYDELNRILTSREPSVNEEERLLLDKEELHRIFYKKYSRFLQEGSWISEDYVDDNLYFLDAQSTLSTSSKPKITYNISVLELSQLEGYENYVFALGDKTTIEDTEFFGWVWRDGVKTPYQEEIVVTELTIMLDSPEQNQIKVQNYKNQFEDLFQRMAATTQSVEYSTGKYQKVAGIVETDGTINITTLQNSITNNALTLQNAKDQSVVWDETGITTTSANNPAEVVRIVSGGIFLSIDGGITWNTGVTGSGINASYITGGQLDVEQVNILNGAFPSFRWDSTGISAYEFKMNDNATQVSNFDFGKFVRLDQYGLYGINGYSNFDSSKPDKDDSGKTLVGEDKIWKHANFALTWRGFQIKTEKYGLNGYVRITAEDDVQLINIVNINGQQREIDQIKIGLLDKKGEEAIYGIRIKDTQGNTVLEQSSQGKVWIKDELKIGALDTSTVSLGYLKKYREDDTLIRDETTGEIIDGISEVIHAGDAASKQEFIVYEDGVLKATGGYFEGQIHAESGYFRGEIHAESGTIGGLSIESITGNRYEVYIESNSGNVFKNGQGTKILTAYLYEGNNLIETGLTYQWSDQDGEIPGATSQTLEVSAPTDSDNVTYSCAISYGAAN